MESAQSSVGRKIAMALTGLMMVLFVVVHMSGNLTIFAGFINAYAQHLHALSIPVWVYRVVMIAAVILHTFLGIQLTLENRAAKARRNVQTKYRSVTFAGETMIWTGFLMLVFIIYHLLHFTLRITNPGISNFVDALGRPDVYKMVVFSFQNNVISVVYAVAMIILFLHLKHGIQSFVQTIGWNSDKTLPVVRRTGLMVSIVLLAGFVAIPFTVIIGILRG